MPLHDARRQFSNRHTRAGSLPAELLQAHSKARSRTVMDKPCASGLRKIWLTRHGESQYNASDKIGGNSGLTSGGKAYAKKLGEVLVGAIPQGQENLQEPVQVWTSTLKRTVETASYIREAYPQRRVPELDEIKAGICEDLTYDEMKTQHPSIFLERKEDKLRYRYPEGESYEDLIARVAPVVEEILAQKGYVIVVAHQAVGRIIYARLMGKPDHEIPTLEMPLHTLFEFTPLADGKFDEKRTKVAVPILRHQITFEDKCHSPVTVSHMPEIAAELAAA